jgi:hypothetical protein
MTLTDPLAYTSALDLVGLTPLLELGSGALEVAVGLLDGPVAMDNPDLTGADVREVLGAGDANCSETDNVACLHGTFVASSFSIPLVRRRCA